MRAFVYFFIESRYIKIGLSHYQMMRRFRCIDGWYLSHRCFICLLFLLLASWLFSHVMPLSASQQSLLTICNARRLNALFSHSSHSLRLFWYDMMALLIRQLYVFISRYLRYDALASYRLILSAPLSGSHHAHVTLPLQLLLMMTLIFMSDITDATNACAAYTQILPRLSQGCRASFSQTFATFAFAFRCRGWRMEDVAWWMMLLRHIFPLPDCRYFVIR